ncbi:hypothetical protein ACFQV2_35965 [Actinokineospora soli]|uniref:Uncharacterized protein n=1 Tax=Actinokineospora soli TaxID=1048753 RepID=A0ABW2TZ59_9PSEU
MTRALAAPGEAAPTPVTEQGRDAWRLDLPGPIELVVDRATAYPLVIRRAGGEVRLADVRLNAPVDRTAFTVELPEGTETSDAGFRRDPLARPLRPGWLPDGFREAETVERNGAVSTAYRRGLESFVVSGGLVFASRDRLTAADRGITVTGDLTPDELVRVADSVP